jgi:hypothetical protein
MQIQTPNRSIDMKCPQKKDFNKYYLKLLNIYFSISKCHQTQKDPLKKLNFWLGSTAQAARTGGSPETAGFWMQKPIAVLSISQEIPKTPPGGTEADGSAQVSQVINQY